MLPLLERNLHSYTFSDLSPTFFAGATQKLSAFPEVNFKTFDLEKPGPEQGFEPGTFDVILGANVLHAVSDVRAALRHIHELLAPGGPSYSSIWPHLSYGRNRSSVSPVAGGVFQIATYVRSILCLNARSGKRSCGKRASVRLLRCLD